MGIRILDTNEYTSVQAVLSGFPMADGIVTWNFLPTDLITPRRLVGYTLIGWWEFSPPPPNAIRNLCDFCACTLTVAQPLNQSIAPVFTNSSPLGGIVSAITNQITLIGNVSGVSIVPTDVTIFRITLDVSDVDIVAQADQVQCHLTLFWDQPRLKEQGQ